MDKNWWLYLIEAEDGKLYTGITTDLKARFNSHAQKKGARFFRTSPPKKIVFTKSCKNRSEALKEEARIKKLSRLQKLALVSQEGS